MPRSAARRGWLMLIRPPNLFTVPGDALAGLVIAGGLPSVPSVRLGAVCLVSLLLYSSGLVLNDWCDRAEDARDRPQRPLPAGLVSSRQALLGASAMLLAAVSMAAVLSLSTALCAIALVALILVYNGFARRVKVLGFLIVGSCRAANLILGATVGDLSGYLGPALAAAAILGLYTVLVAALAEPEARQLPAKPLILCLYLVPPVLLLSGLGGLLSPGCFGIWVVWLLLAGNTVGLAIALWRNEQVQRTPGYIGALIRNLIIIQAFWVAASGAPCYVIAAVLVLWPCATWLGRRFYGS